MLCVRRLLASRFPLGVNAALRMAQVTVVEAGGELPQAFSRCVYLAGAAGRVWASEAVDLLKQAGFDDGVIVLGDRDVAFEEWRTATILLSDAVVCWAPMGTERSEHLTRLVTKWGSTGKLFAGHPQDSWAAPLTSAAGCVVAPSLEDLITITFKKVKAGQLRTGPEREIPLMIWNTAPWDCGMRT